MAREVFFPESIDEAVRTLGEHPEALFLAGGTEVNAWERRRVAARPLISLGRIGLQGIERDGAGIRVGALTTLQALASAPVEGAAALALLAEAARHVTNRHVRNVATIGGNIGAQKSCSDLLPALLVLEGRLRLAGADPAEIPVGEYGTLPAPRPLILDVFLPTPALAFRGALRRFSRSANDLALVKVAAACRLVEGRLRDVRLAAGGVGAHPRRLPEVEALLEGAEAAALRAGGLAAAAAAARAAAATIDDHRGGAAFKRTILGVLVERALAACLS
jgi:probable selenate reductase FAD-binding subunit